MDIQLNGFGSLENLVSQGVPGEFINVTIAYMVTNKEWKWKALSHLLPMQEHYFGRSQRSYKGQLQDIGKGLCNQHWSLHFGHNGIVGNYDKAGNGLGVKNQETSAGIGFDEYCIDTYYTGYQQSGQ